MAHTFKTTPTTTTTILFVHYGGVCTVPGGIFAPNHVLRVWENQHRDQLRSNWKNIYIHYKYCLVMENTQQEGYVTEKLLYGLLGGCLLIYYGSKEVNEIFYNNYFVYWDIDDP